MTLELNNLSEYTGEVTVVSFVLPLSSCDLLDVLLCCGSAIDQIHSIMKKSDRLFAF